MENDRLVTEFTSEVIATWVVIYTMPVAEWIAVTEWEAFREEAYPAIATMRDIYMFDRRISSVNRGVMGISLIP
ncbi:MAG: hypothetical protein J5I35_08680 [Methanothrix harundinacea]|uniref:Uncharacterized protein n=1 Tax=Methanothrix harundinacea TaxID=301375 RepID=A0A101ILA7_9EURY|nr:MAG: hypothetical protein XE07_0747 [Methanothrix harundinacea]MCP1392818.1 hypothetical protein [Methanothrix harundinacea]